MKAWRWYVYRLVDSRDGSTFYVGKGTRNRIRQHEAYARHGVCSEKTRRIKEIWGANARVIQEYVAYFRDEQDAFDFERDLIDQIGLERLTNRTGGGNGGATWKATQRLERLCAYLNAGDVEGATAALLSIGGEDPEAALHLLLKTISLVVTKKAG